MLIGLVIALLGGFFFALKIDPVRPHHTDSIWYASIAREMLQTGNWLIPHYDGKADFWKPPLHYWLIATSYTIFGVSAVSAVLPSLFLASLGLFLVWLMGVQWFGPRGAILACLVLATNAQYYESATLSMMDLGVAIFILLSLFSFFMSERSKKPALWIVLFFIFSALGVLLKSVQGILIPCAIVFIYLIVMRKNPWWSHKKAVLLGVVLFVLISAPWFVYMRHQFGHQYTQFIAKEQIFGRLVGDLNNWSWRFTSFFRSFFDVFGPFTILCLFVVSSVVVAIKKVLKGHRDEPLVFLLAWSAVVFGLFSISSSHGTRYFMPIIPAMSLLVGGYFSKIVDNDEIHFSFRFSFLVTLVALMISFVLAHALLLWVLPQDKWFLLFPYSVIVGLAMVLFSVFYGQKKFSQIPFLFTGFIALVLIVSFIFLVPTIEAKPNVHFVEVLNKQLRNNEVVGSDTYKGQKELIFFGQGRFKTRYLGSLDEIGQFLNSPETVFCILKEDSYHALSPDIQKRLVILDRKQEWRRMSSKTLDPQSLHQFFTDAQTESFLVTNQESKQ